MDECDKRAIGSLSHVTCIEQNRYPTLGMSKGKEREREMRGRGGEGKPANNPCDYKRSVRKWLAQRPTERDERTWSCFWALMR